MNLGLIFLTGLTAGGFSCLALQGGLLATTLANLPSRSKIFPTVVFLISKLIAYILLGGLLGYFGSVFQLTSSMKIAFQAFAAVLMLGLAANMLELHPIFRYFVIQPPKWAGKLLRHQAQRGSWFAPAMMGLFTVLIPCPVTQSMEVLAISSGSWWQGAAIMGSFILGTSPIFMALGWVTGRLSDLARKRFFQFAAALIIYISLSSLNGALVLADSKYSFNNWVWAFKSTFLVQSAAETSQEITINVGSRGYTPNNFSVKSGSPVKLNVITSNSRSCANDFNIPALGIRKILPSSGTTEITFTPQRQGPLAFTCGMGMYTGTINVQ